MRDIKFRGMTANGDFVYGDLSHDRPNETAYYKEYSQRICWYVGAAHHNQPVKNGTVGQFTGLLDRDDKEIYEGDILGGVFGLPIQWCNRCKSLQLVDCLYGCYACEGDFHWHEVVEYYWANKLKIIGNIHKNPDLLEGGVEL